MIDVGGGAVSQKLLEALADSEHDRWSKWMRYLFGKSRMFCGFCIIPRASVQCWKRQMATPYKELSEHEKDSDRKWADRTISIIICHESKGEP